MFAESIDYALMEFIYAVNQCHEDDGTFTRDKRYDRIVTRLLELPIEKLTCYAGQLEMIASRSTYPKWQKFVYRFRRDLEVLTHS